MPKINIGFVGGAYSSRSRHVDMQECVNMYPQREAMQITGQYTAAGFGVGLSEPKSKSVGSLIGCPGLDLISAPDTIGNVRGMIATSDGKFYTVIGNAVFSMQPDGTATFLGNVIGTNPIVGLAENGSQGGQVIIVDESRGWIIDTTLNTVTPISNFPGGTHVVFKDGRFLVNRPGTGQMFWSDAPGYDGSAWVQGNFGTAESSPDSLTALAKTNNDLWLFGPLSYEVWQADIDQNPGPSQGQLIFDRQSNLVGDIGTPAPYSPASIGNDLYWLGSNNRGHGVIWHNNGYSPERISTHGIEYIISKMARIDDAIGFCYQQEGHYFYVLTFPTADKTLVYDAMSGLWHERQYFNPTTGYSSRHRAQTCAFFDGMVLVGDREDSRIYKWDLDTYTDDGDPIVRTRTCPHINNSMDRVYYNEFEVDMEKGVGLPNGQGSNPQAMLSWSDDGGFTFGKERWDSPGRVGEYKTRMHWHSLGSSRNRIFRFKMTDPVKVVLIESWVEVEGEDG